MCMTALWRALFLSHRMVWFFDGFVQRLSQINGGSMYVSEVLGLNSFDLPQEQA